MIVRYFVLLALLLPCALVAQEAAPTKVRIKRADARKIRDTREAMGKLAENIETHQTMFDSYPESLQDLIKNELMTERPKDGWGKLLSYKTSAEHGFEVESYGADGKPGGAGADRDLLWTRKGFVKRMTRKEIADRDRELGIGREKARKVLARAEMAVLGGKVADYRREKGNWPESLKAVRPEGESESEKALLRCFDDPWGYEYQLKLMPHDNFGIICRGRDGKEGGSGAAADFVVTEREAREALPTDEARWNPWRFNHGDWQVEELADSVSRYKGIHNKLPETLDDLTGGQKPVRSSIPLDLWERAYTYLRLGEDEFYIVALGKDGKPGGRGESKDVIRPEPGAAADSWGGVERGFAVPAPKQNDDEILLEVADEMLLDLVEKINEHHEANGAYPKDLDEIKESFPGEEVPKDPWEHDFVYALTYFADGTIHGFTVKTLAADGKVGGSDNDADLTYNQAGVRVESEDNEGGEDPDSEPEQEH